MASDRRTFFSDFRTFFLRGLAIALPTVITVGLLFWAFTFLHRHIASPINAAVRWGVVQATPHIVPEAHRPQWYSVTEAQMASVIAEREAKGLDPLRDGQAVRRTVRALKLKDVWERHWYLSGIGFVVALILVYLAGVLVGNFVGRRMYQRAERLFIRLPVIKQVYPNVKQITDFLLGSEEAALPKGRVCVVEYPRRGVWTVGLMTGETLTAIERVAGARCVTIFIPSSPTPFTGYTITVPQDEVYELPLTLDEAIRFVVSGGVLVPERQSHGVDADDPEDYRLKSTEELADPLSAPVIESDGSRPGPTDREP